MTSADRSHEKPSQGTWAPRFTRVDWLLLLVVFAVAVSSGCGNKGTCRPE